MKKGVNASKGLYAGTGTGLILFLLVGMFPGALIGGAAGLLVTNMVLGAPVEPTIIPRIIMVLSMVVGIMSSAAVFIVGTSVLGWSIGAAIDTVQASGQESASLESATEKNHS